MGCTNLTVCFFKDLRKEKNCSIEILEKYFDRFSICKYTCVLSMGDDIEEPDFIQYNNNKSFIDEDFSYDFQS